ncbi:3'-5' exonuclease [Lichenifustis flavocetrariae]|uniref:3'-5' exonuclease n=1 Tax=Lichenifustis flavocetrariae TaxID=2949735 RepID=A0AA41Z269_9HYPH|nr:3'-5' exonuclease [Lichenifustis flavocetrariae]MCW6512854.1 3'-5' exonuclease [Lichenifustis flavocetrariae]
MLAETEELALKLENTGEYRVLRRIATPSGPSVPHPPDPGQGVGIVLDCETTGLDPAKAEIIELAMLRFEYDVHGVRRLLGAFTGLQEPSGAIPREITAITGLADVDVAGQAIDDGLVEAFAAGADLVIAHNAGFDRRFTERRWPGFACLPWSCSLSQIPWREEGFEAARLKLLLAEAGFFHRGHRALDDAAATLHLIGLPLPRSGRSGFDHMMERTRAPSARVWALGAPFEAKDLLKRRGFKWCDGSGGLPRAWNVDLPSSAAEAELAYLAEHVYRNRSPALAVPVTALDRFTDRAGVP